MIGRINMRLNGKHILWVAHVRSQILRHLLHRLNQPGENFAEGLHDRVGGIAQIVIDRAVVRVNHGLHRIANVIRPLAAQRLRIGKALRRRIAVENPKKSPVLGDDEVGVTIEGNKWGDFLDAVVDPPMIQNAALRGQILR